MKFNVRDSFQARQGDVFILSAGLLGKVQKKSSKQIVLARGEATGHAHKIVSENADLFENEKRQRFVVIQGGRALVEHEEHAPIEIPEGTYEVIRQREWQDEEIRNVED